MRELLAGVRRINALWHLLCCALPVSGFGEGGRELKTQIPTPVRPPRVFPKFREKLDWQHRGDGRQLATVLRIVVRAQRSRRPLTLERETVRRRVSHQGVEMSALLRVACLRFRGGRASGIYQNFYPRSVRPGFFLSYRKLGW